MLRKASDGGSVGLLAPRIPLSSSPSPSSPLPLSPARLPNVGRPTPGRFLQWAIRATDGGARELPAAGKNAVLPFPSLPPPLAPSRKTTPGPAPLTAPRVGGGGGGGGGGGEGGGGGGVEGGVGGEEGAPGSPPRPRPASSSFHPPPSHPTHTYAPCPVTRVCPVPPAYPSFPFHPLTLLRTHLFQSIVPPICFSHSRNICVKG